MAILDRNFSVCAQGRPSVHVQCTIRMACKETTAQILRSWFFPLTIAPHILSSYFISAKDLMGYPDADPDAGEIALDVRKWKLIGSISNLGQFLTNYFNKESPEQRNGNLQSRYKELEEPSLLAWLPDFVAYKHAPHSYRFLSFAVS